MQETKTKNEMPDIAERPPLLTVYRWALAFIKPYRWQMTLLILCGMVLTAGELAIPKFIQHFTDHILIQHDLSQFKFFILALIIIVALIITATAFMVLLERIVQEKASRDLQYTIYAQLRKLGFAYFENHPIGESLALMHSEVSALQQFYRDSLPDLIKGAVFSVLALSFMLLIHVKLSFVMLLGLGLYYIFGPYLDKKASIYAKALSDRRVAFNQKTYESIASLTDIRANGAEKWDLKIFLQELRAFNKQMVQTYLFAYLRGTNRRISYNLGGIAIIIYGVHLVKTGGMTTGELIAFLLLFFQTMFVITAVISSLTEQRVQMHQAEKLYRFMQLPAAVKEAALPAEISEVNGSITFRHVSFGYEEGPPILRDVHLHIAPGERIAIVGESGGGKTTMIKLLGRFYDPSSGEILLDDTPINQLSFANLRHHLGFVFQETYLFGATVKENILFGRPDATDGEVEEAARAAYAHDFIQELEHGYGTFLGERGVKLSEGQKQRISIARMFIKNPSVLLLDEATSALDNVSEGEVKLALDRLMKGRTTIAIAHRLSTIMDYDKIVLLENGVITETGTYDQLLQNRRQFFKLATGSEKEAML